MEDSLLPDEVLCRFITLASPITLYYIHQNIFHDEELLYNSQQRIRRLLEETFVVNLLCQEHDIKQVSNFGDFLLQWDFWNLDTSAVTPEYFSRRWKFSLTQNQALHICGKNSQINDSRWLIQADRILNDECLWCCDSAIFTLCGGSGWLPALTNTYTKKILHYTKSRWSRSSVLPHLFGKLEEQEKSLKSSDYHDVKDLLDTTPRQIALEQAILNDDYRLLIHLNTTAEEICDTYIGEPYLEENEIKKCRYFYDLGVNSCQFNDPYYCTWYELFRNKEIVLQGENILYMLLTEIYHVCNVYMEYLNMGLKLTDDKATEFMMALTSPKGTTYYPYYIRFFTERLGPQVLQAKHELLQNLAYWIKGDQLMMTWLTKQEYLK